MDPTKKITAKEDFFSTSYYQDEVEIKSSSMNRELKKNESLRSNIEFVERAFYPTLLLAMVGGWYLGKYISETDKKENLYISLATTLPSFYLGYKMEQKVNQAIKVHNESIAITPLLGPKTAGGHLSFSF